MRYLALAVLILMVGCADQAEAKDGHCGDCYQQATCQRQMVTVTRTRPVIRRTECRLIYRLRNRCNVQRSYSYPVSCNQYMRYEMPSVVEEEIKLD